MTKLGVEQSSFDIRHSDWIFDIPALSPDVPANQQFPIPGHLRRSRSVTIFVILSSY